MERGGFIYGRRGGLPVTGGQEKLSTSRLHLSPTGRTTRGEKIAQRRFT